MWYFKLYKSTLVYINMDIVLATNNQGKIREFRKILNNSNINLILQSNYNVPDIEETGITFVENAIIKARHASKCTGLPAIADDSGLSVDCLNGQPGVYSARYSGEHATDQENISKLLHEISKYPEEARTARYWCVIVFMKHFNDPTPIICQNSWEGIITSNPRGSNGFGYDPCFYVPGLGKTASEISLEMKCKLDAHCQSMRQVIEIISEMYK